jgi:hypothetical protein
LYAFAGCFTRTKPPPGFGREGSAPGDVSGSFDFAELVEIGRADRRDVGRNEQIGAGAFDARARGHEIRDGAPKDLMRT